MVSDADFQVEVVSNEPPVAPVEETAAPVVAAVETAPEADADPDPAESEQESERDEQGRFTGKKPRSNTQARISQAVTKQREAEAKAAALAEELERLRAEYRPTPAPAEPKPAASAPAKPTRDTFINRIGVDGGYPTYEAALDAYDDAREAWREAQQPKIDALIEQRLAAKQGEQAAQRILSAHQARMAAAETQYPDYKATVGQAEQLLADMKVTLSPALQYAMFDSPKSADVVYYLATHPTELLQLARESATLPVSAAALLRRDLESRLTAGVPPGSASAALSTAKPPVRPVGASQAAPVDEGSDSEPFDVFFHRENARDRKRVRI